MSNTILMSEPTVDSIMLTWTGLRLERGVSSTNLGSFQLVAQIPYVFGQTTYTYFDAAGAPSDWYRVARYAPSVIGTYSPPWPVTPPITTAGEGARRSLKACRRMLARKLGSLQVVLATADGAADGSTIVSRALANQIDPNRHRSWWVMPTDGVSSGEIRIVAENALNAATGSLLIGPPFLSQIVQGTQIELHRLMPPDEDVGPVLGLKQALNMALAELWTVDRITVAGAASPTLDLGALGDWMDPDAVYEVYSTPIAGNLALPYGGYNARRDAASVALDVFGLAVGGSLDVELTRPGDSYIKVEGVWTDGQQGFKNDDDECLFQPLFLAEVALAYCYEALANSVTGSPQVRFQKLAEEQRRKVNTMKRVPGALPRPAQRRNGATVGDEWLYGGLDEKSYWP